MGAVWMLGSCEIRRRARGVVVLVLLIGIVGAIVLATVAGARRSDAALARFIAYSRPSDLEVDVGDPTGAQLNAFRHTPGVFAAAALHGYALIPDGRPNLAIAAAVDRKLGSVVDRARVVEGRQADPAEANEVAIGESLAAQAHLGVGGHLTVASLTPAQIAVATSGREPGPPAGPRVRLRIVGIVRRPLDLGDRAASGGVVVLTPAFDRVYRNRIGYFDTILRVRTRNSATDEPRVTAAARRVFRSSSFISVQGVASESQGAGSAINVLTVALWVFAAVTALAGAVAIAIVLSREISQVSADQSTLRALGLTHRQRVAISAPRALLIAGGGVLLAMLGAAAASPLFPIGLARRADLDPGLHFDWRVLAPGVVGFALFVVLIAFLAAMRATKPSSFEHERGAHRRRPAIVEMAAGMGLRPPVANGLRLALQPGSGETAMPVRSAFLGAVFGVAGVTAVLMFAANLNHVVATPRLYGWTWDFKAPDDTFTTSCGPTDFGLAAKPGVAAVAAVCYQGMQIDGRPVTGWGFTHVRGTIDPEVVAGRAPRGPGEVALGSVTLHALRKHIGDTVEARGPKATHNYRIVGRIVLPSLQEGDLQPLADGAAFTGRGLARIPDDGNTTRYLLGRFDPGVDRAVVVRRINAIPQIEPLAQSDLFGARGVSGPTLPPEVDRLRKIDWFLPALAALLAVLALIAVGHALLSASRRRRRELAILKTLGFDRRQVRATVAWQAMTIATVGLIVGIPTGLLIGTFVWRLVADGLGVSANVVLPALGIVLTVAAALAVVNLIAFFPGRAAARTQPAVALASE